MDIAQLIHHPAGPHGYVAEFLEPPADSIAELERYFGTVFDQYVMAAASHGGYSISNEQRVKFFNSHIFPAILPYFIKREYPASLVLTAIQMAIFQVPHWASQELYAFFAQFLIQEGMTVAACTMIHCISDKDYARLVFKSCIEISAQKEASEGVYPVSEDLAGIYLKNYLLDFITKPKVYVMTALVDIDELAAAEALIDTVPQEEKDSYWSSLAIHYARAHLNVDQALACARKSGYYQEATIMHCRQFFELQNLPVATRRF